MREDIYCRKRWRRVQYVLNQFWLRWRTEYLQNLQIRQKWIHPQRNLQEGDLVLIKDDNSPRNQWPLARIVEVQKSEDGLVRTAKIQIGTSDLSDHGKRRHAPSYLVRPIQKIVLVLPMTEGL